MTPTARAALQWFADNGPIGWFDLSAPSQAMRRRLVRIGLIEEIIPNHRAGLIKFKISRAGRDALAWK